jgi:type I restriction enzyme R subunit
VVSKLLTGFDAPSCTYIYLDNELRDHNLFQAICRTNRLDGDDKDYGHIVDYKQLFNNVQNAIAVYTSDELDIDEGGDNGNVTVKDWLKEGRAKLDAVREALFYLCEPVAHPQEVEHYIHYFCGDAANASALSDTEPLRVSFYKSVAAFIRAYADVAQNLAEAGYSAGEIAALEHDTQFFSETRAANRKPACRRSCTVITKRQCCTATSATFLATRMPFANRVPMRYRNRPSWRWRSIKPCAKTHRLAGRGTRRVRRRF